MIYVKAYNLKLNVFDEHIALFLKAYAVTRPIKLYTMLREILKNKSSTGTWDFILTRASSLKF